MQLDLRAGSAHTASVETGSAGVSVGVVPGSEVLTQISDFGHFSARSETFLEQIVFPLRLRHDQEYLVRQAFIQLW